MGWKAGLVLPISSCCSRNCFGGLVFWTSSGVIVETGEGEGLKAVIDSCVFLGLNTHYFVHLLTGEKAEIIQESSIDSIIQPGTQVRLRLNTEKANLFTQDGSRNLLTGVENDLVKEAV